jgi:CubicO group peptidase (beta-lactamase class C family)
LTLLFPNPVFVQSKKRKHTMIRLITIFTLLLQGLSVAAQTSNLYFPPQNSENWTTESPAALGFCNDRIDSLYQFLEGRDTKSFILLHDGKIVLEKYFGTFVRDSFWYWASAGKSLTSFLVGQAQDEGLLHIEDKTSQYLGIGWTSCPIDKEDRITISGQLTMTTGLEDNVPDDNCGDPACLTYKADAGTRWAYHNAPYRLLHDVIQEASGLTIQQFTKTRILDKTGMKGFWVDHIQYGRARDMARFGLLTLANGIWNGDTLLRNQAYVAAMSTPSQMLNKSYGYLWWLNGQPSYMLPGLQFNIPGPLCPNAPPDMFAALGKNDQKIHVVPSKGWVVVRQGNPATAAGSPQVPVVFDNELWAYLNALNCDPTATGEVNNDAPVLHIMPTIATDGWYITSSAPIRQVRIINTTGQVVKTLTCRTGEKEIFMPADHLTAGLYFLECTGENGKRGALHFGFAQ